MQPSPPSLLTSLHPLLNTHSILSSSPPPSNKRRCFSSTSHLCHSCKTSQSYGWISLTLWTSSPPGQLWPPGESTVVFWKVDKFEQWWKRCDPPLYSTPYFTSRHGYRMCLRAYLNGDGLGKGTHPSFYFAIMWGLLPWSFCQKVMLTLIWLTLLVHIHENVTNSGFCLAICSQNHMPHQLTIIKQCMVLGT